MSNLDSDLQNAKPILVTGAHRSGTTWVGSMLAASDKVAYIHEPLNVLKRPGVLRITAPYWYTYISEQNESEFAKAFEHTLSYRYSLGKAITSVGSRSDFWQIFRDSKHFLTSWFCKRRALLKDPFAVLSSLWFINRLGCQVVVVVRHPLAYVSSLKRLNWMFQLEDLLAQPLLMRDWLDPYRSEMTQCPKADVVGRAAMLWKMIYAVVREIQQTQPQLIVVRHEDLSLEPVRSFANLYSTLGLVFTPRTERVIHNATCNTNPSEIASVHSTNVNSSLNLLNWKHRLSREESHRIMTITAATAEYYYPDKIITRPLCRSLPELQ